MPLLIQYSLFSVEMLVILLSLAAVSITGRTRLPLLGSFRAMVARLATRQRLAITVSFALPLMLRLLAWPFLRIPTPSIHDEFSYLLMADTFAHGRLANPTHPFWIHFDTIHVLQHPTYASIYPVMQGIFLAVGQALLHNPWWGIWLSVALMCGAFCWALQAWLPPSGALAGAALAALRLGTFSYWMNSYWGGAPAALGGALVLGALPRLISRQRPRDAVILGIGLLVLANSRPYEGLAFSIPIVVVLVAWTLGSDEFCGRLGFRPIGASDWSTRARRALLPLAVVLIAGAIATGYYFWRVTGNPLTMPYVAEARQYGVAPVFRWQKVRHAPAYTDDRLRYFYGGWAARPVTEGVRVFEYWAFYLAPVLTIPLLLLPHLLRDRRIRFPLIACSFVILAVAVEWWAQPHYAAPATVAGYAVLLQGIRYLRCLARRTRWQNVWAVIPATLLLMIAVRVAMPYAGLPPRPLTPQTWASMLPPFNTRLDSEQHLESLGGKHLVLVRYADHDREPNVHNEWVYNAADIDHARIVWARELDEPRNRELLDYFRGRQVWIADAERGTIQPVP